MIACGQAALLHNAVLAAALLFTTRGIRAAALAAAMAHKKTLAQTDFLHAQKPPDIELVLRLAFNPAACAFWLFPAWKKPAQNNRAHDNRMTALPTGSGPLLPLRASLAATAMRSDPCSAALPGPSGHRAAIRLTARKQIIDENRKRPEQIAGREMQKRYCCSWERMRLSASSDWASSRKSETVSACAHSVICRLIVSSMSWSF